MTDEIAPRSTVNEMTLDPQGHPMVPRDPDLAKARLAELEASPEYVDAVTDPLHPLHAQRLEERRGLMVIITGGKYGPHPLTPDEQHLADLSERFRANVTKGIE